LLAARSFQDAATRHRFPTHPRGQPRDRGGTGAVDDQRSLLRAVGAGAGGCQVQRAELVAAPVEPDRGAPRNHAEGATGEGSGRPLIRATFTASSSGISTTSSTFGWARRPAIARFISGSAADRRPAL